MQEVPTDLTDLVLSKHRDMDLYEIKLRKTCLLISEQVENIRDSDSITDTGVSD